MVYVFGSEHYDIILVVNVTTVRFLLWSLQQELMKTIMKFHMRAMLVRFCHSFVSIDLWYSYSMQESSSGRKISIQKKFQMDLVPFSSECCCSVIFIIIVYERHIYIYHHLKRFLLSFFVLLSRCSIHRFEFYSSMWNSPFHLEKIYKV